MRIITIFFMAVILFTRFGQAAEAITNAAQLAEAVLAESPSARPFAFKAQVTCLIPHGERYLYMTVMDDTGCAFVAGEIPDSGDFPDRGDVVHLAGTLAGDTARFSSVRRIATSTPPAPRDVTANDVASGRVDWQYSRLRGMIRDIRASETDKRWTFLVLASGDEIVYVALPTDDLASLLGATVKIDGFANPRDRSRRIYLGRTFHCGGKCDIHVLDEPESDPFAVPDVGNLRHCDPHRIACLGRHRLQGRILTRFNGTQALARTSNRDVVRLVFDAPPPPAGTFLVATGFPETDFFHLTLTHVVWEALPEPHEDIPEPPAQDIADFYRRSNTDQPLNADFHGRLVRAKGVVRSLPSRDDVVPRMLLETCGHLTSVNVECLQSIESLPSVGSEIAVAGTCVLEAEVYRASNLFPQISGLTIVMNGPDLSVVSRPSRWTRGRLVAIIAALLAVLLTVLVWNRILNRLAERRGRQLLREKIGRAAADFKTDERMRLAVELHDSLAQNLTGVSMEIEAAGRCGRENADELMHHLTIADKALKSCRNELRNTLWDLRNQSLEDKDLNQAIRKTLLPHIKHVSLTVDVGIPRSALSDNRVHDLLCIVRELALNAIRHGEASQIVIRGEKTGGEISLTVEDNGRGFEPDAAPGVADGHFGLEGIRQRLSASAGALSYTRSDHGIIAHISFHP